MEKLTNDDRRDVAKQMHLDNLKNEPEVKRQAAMEESMAKDRL